MAMPGIKKPIQIDGLVGTVKVADTKMDNTRSESGTVVTGRRIDCSQVVADTK